MKRWQVKTTMLCEQVYVIDAETPEIARAALDKADPMIDCELFRHISSIEQIEN